MAPVLHAEPPVKPSSLEGAETPAATRAWGDVPAAGEGDVASCISCRVMQRELQCRSSAGAAGPYGFATAEGAVGGTAPPEDGGIGKRAAGQGWMSLRSLRILLCWDPADQNGSNLIMSSHPFCMPWPYTPLVCRISGQWSSTRPCVLEALCGGAPCAPVIWVPLWNADIRPNAKCQHPGGAGAKGCQHDRRQALNYCISIERERYLNYSELKNGDALQVPMFIFRRDTGSAASHHRAFKDACEAVPICVFICSWHAFSILHRR